MKDDSWMEKTKGGKRRSAYSKDPSPKREKVRREKGNIGQVIRERANRYKDI